MGYNKTIQMCIFGGNPNGRIMCELSNWNGRVYKISRSELNEFAKRDDAEYTGVYFLFGKNSDNDETIYIGEAEKLVTRLKQHLKDESYWNDCIVVLSKDRRFYFEHNDNPIPLSGVLSMIEEMDLLIHQSEFSFKISAKGWERIDELRNKENEIKQGFIAMSFDDVAVSICEAFKEAIDAAGYAFYISKEKEHNNQVVPEMLFEIQRSKFKSRPRIAY